MKHIYAISGLGADERVFNALKKRLRANWTYIPWLEPKPDEPIEQYAFRMSRQIDQPKPILLGLSFGGIMAVEISHHVSAERLVLISTIKNRLEMPFWLKIVSLTRVHKIIPLQSISLTAPLQNYMLGVTNQSELNLAIHYRKNIDSNYLKWAVDRVVNWKPEPWHTPFLHVHGTCDHIFPIKYLKQIESIEGGGHLMIMNKAAEISQRINQWLNQPD